jgi:ornithine cyclodeaminase/alanine dehydrogenase-like protein (mu-crystallin family)
LALLLRENDVRALLSMREAISVTRAALASDAAQNLPRRRLDLAGGALNVMAASLPSSRAAGLKAYSANRLGARFIVALWDRDDGRLLALIEADALGRLRTGAASGVATDLMANQDASILALVGCGRQAKTQLQAIASVRRLRDVRVYSRNPERGASFAAETREQLDLPVRAVDSGRGAVDGADIVCTITTAAAPVVFGDWLDAGAHVNAAGSNVSTRREVDTALVRRAALIAVCSVEQAHLEAGDLIIAHEEGATVWERVVEIGEVLAGRRPGRRSPQDLTLFKSLGVAVEDVAVARHVFDKAVAQGVGEQTNFGDVA